MNDINGWLQLRKNPRGARFADIYSVFTFLFPTSTLHLRDMWILHWFRFAGTSVLVFSYVLVQHPPTDFWIQGKMMKRIKILWSPCLACQNCSTVVVDILASWPKIRETRIRRFAGSVLAENVWKEPVGSKKHPGRSLPSWSSLARASDRRDTVDCLHILHFCLLLKIVRNSQCTLMKCFVCHCIKCIKEVNVPSIARSIYFSHPSYPTSWWFLLPKNRSEQTRKHLNCFRHASVVSPSSGLRPDATSWHVHDPHAKCGRGMSQYFTKAMSTIVLSFDTSMHSSFL